ncbi:MAG: hypothetical protein ACN4GR_11710 [Arenicellales bacterium]
MVKTLLQLVVSLSIAGVSFLAFARDPEIRMYKMTRDGHSVKYTLFGKADNPGCHNTPYTYHVYKVAVLAYKSCSVYSAKDCQPESILPVYWKGKDKISKKMKQGTRWFLARDGSEIAVSSWSCEVK